MAGVERRMLERDGDEVARATSVVRFASGSHFPRHEHARGEEFLVLEGTLSDEQGHYPAGTCVRNPPGSAHAPWSERGCVLFVKLRQFHRPGASGHRLPLGRVVSRDCEGHRRFAAASLWKRAGFAGSLAPNTRFLPHEHPGGEEIFVLNGAVEDEEGRYAAGSWLRNPPGSQHAPFSLEGLPAVRENRAPAPPW